MTIQEIKLALIRKITACEDQQKLVHLLQLIDKPTTSVQTSELVNEQMIQTLLQSDKSPNTVTSAKQEDVDDLQQSINELFGN